MAAVTVKRKRRGCVRGKRKSKSVSTVKLSNKRLNKLAKQGKLKKRLTGRQLKELGRSEQRHLVTESDETKTPCHEDIPLEEADYNYFASESRDFRFLTSVSSPHSNNAVRPNEALYEQRPRGYVNSTNTTTKHLLPIKSQKHGLQAQSVEVSEDIEDTNQVVCTRPEVVEPVKLPKLTAAELSTQRMRKLAERRRDIALLASSVIENPEENLKKLKELITMMQETDADICITARKLAAASLLEIFRDIIPDYRIRVATQIEKQQSVKKDMVKLRNYEECLLNYYKSYLEAIEAFTTGKVASSKRKRSKKTEAHIDIQGEPAKVLRMLGVRCACELLVAHPHFNFRTNLIAMVIPYMEKGGTEMTTMVCSYITRVFKEDKSGEVTLEVVRLIGRLIKSRKFNVKPKVLNTFLSLRIKEVEKNEDVGKKKMSRKEKFLKTSRRDRKKNKEKAELEKELQNASMSQDKRHKMRLNAEIIQLVFLTYFRILKQARHSILLPSVLEGLAKFAHLINVDFFDDLFSVLNDLVESDDLTYRESLHCVQTAFTILSGQGEALNIDPLRFYRHLYMNLFHLHAGLSSDDVPVALVCLDIMIRKRRKQVSQRRLFAFVKRLTTLSLQMCSEGALGMLTAVRSYMHVDSKTDILLDTDWTGGGIYLPELPEAEHCNAHATALYELHLLRHHYHPAVRCYADHLLLGAPSQGAGQLPVDIGRKSSMEIFNDYNSNTMAFNPPVDSKPSVKVKRVMKPSHTFHDADIEKKANMICTQLENTDLSQFDFTTG